MSTSKSAPTLNCFVHFDFEMCLPPQWRALFLHLNFQKCSGHGVLCTFSLGKCASHHNGMHFFIISTSKSGLRPSVFYTFDFETCCAPQWRATFHLSSGRWLRTRRFSEPTLRPFGATNHWKNRVNRDFSTFSRTCIFFPLTLSLL